MSEVQKLVDSLNDKLWEGDDNYNHCFIYKKLGLVEAIGLEIVGDYATINVDLWNDQDDSRKWLEKIDDYEPFPKTIMRNYKNVLSLANNIYKQAK